MMLADLIAGLNIRTAAAGAIRICDITDDSRTVVTGSLFIARTGQKADGREFVRAALDAGAVAVLTDDRSLRLPEGSGAALLLAGTGVELAAAQIAERFYGSASGRLTLIGVTGTNGKTTTAHLIHQILNRCGVRCGLMGTVLIDDGAEIAPSILTTPPATELSRTFGVMVDSGCRAAVMEVSSHALDQERPAALAFKIGVFTNLTGDHLDYHGTMEKYADAKAKLFAMLPENGLAIVNADDRASARMIRDCRAPVLRCTIGAAVGRKVKAGECRASIRAMTMAGTRAAFAGPWGAITCLLPLVGRHNVMNALQAAAACHGAGVKTADIAEALEHAAAPPGRLEVVTGARHPYSVLVDYAHTDDALRQVLGAIRPLMDKGGTLRVVFGCGGDRDRTKRARMGAAAAELADAVYITSDNPRTEEPSAIIDEIIAGVPARQRRGTVVDADRRSAIARAIADARAGDVVLIAGKGHETDQILSDGKGGTIRTHFDDREVARELLAPVKRARPGARKPVIVTRRPAKAAGVRARGGRRA